MMKINFYRQFAVLTIPEAAFRYSTDFNPVLFPSLLIQLLLQMWEGNSRSLTWKNVLHFCLLLDLITRDSVCSSLSGEGLGFVGAWCSVLHILNSVSDSGLCALVYFILNLALSFPRCPHSSSLSPLEFLRSPEEFGEILAFKEQPQDLFDICFCYPQKVGSSGVMGLWFRE